MELRQLMKVYDNDKLCVNALELLMDDDWVKSMGWRRVFHEGVGEGLYSPTENIVAVFDIDDVPTYHSYHFYRFNENAWKFCDGDGWDKIYNGDNGADFEVEEID